ncbi:sugar (and other) transporter family protein [Anoxybacillus sp. B7M1]|jgi:MFS transporter, MHS family, proline/betaine transporter|uniref:MFS transporter n=1 Tax=unclassified Anoxybacillus TaxID=2639704 RepID=UPI0007B5AE01|nr:MULTISPECIES: MFS transporter [unclassified Anoxybacillus]ANB57328.1 sugar (and other) transporter family protein [Anoxybacillus sp. B2M1]ANB63251.1 sugar (and other) transporter family protein [Anoxybacillus sp. B7M1]
MSVNTETTVQQTSPLALSISRKQMMIAVMASLLGWSLDLYDLFILLYVAPELGKLFFPTDKPTLSLAAVYASFAVTLCMRPLGSALFGTYADRNGRKRAMVVAVSGVGISTALLGALPTVAQIGAAAAIIFIVLRLIQGVFVGGVVASTHTIGTESVPEKWRGLMSGLVGGGGAALGALLASIVYFVLSNIFSGPEFSEWGWRFMFFTGILSSVLGLFVFKKLEESPLWVQHKKTQEAKQENQQSPVKMVFTKYLSVLLINLMIVIGGGSAYYLTCGYLPTFLKVINNIPQTVSSMILMISSISAMIASVALGHLSTIIGRKKTFILLGIVNLIVLPYLYTELAAAQDLTLITLYAMGLAFLGNGSYAPVLIFLNERFPTAIRSTGTGLSWNMGFAVGGMMPTFVTMASSQTSDIPLSLTYFSIALFLLYLLGSFIIPETKGNFK